MYKIVTSGGINCPANYFVFICDSESDLQSFVKDKKPCAGSKGIVTNPYKEMILCTDLSTWVEKVGSSSISGGTGGDNPGGSGSDNDCFDIEEAIYLEAIDRPDGKAVEIPDTWEEIIDVIHSGRYKERYKIGDYKPLDLGSEGVVNMELVGIEVDDRADGTGKAPATFVSKELLKSSCAWNPVYVAKTTGTGTLGGWQESAIRKHYQNAILPLIPNEVKPAIIDVLKSQDAYRISGDTEESFAQSSADTIWCPSGAELSTKKYTMDAARKKTGSSSYSHWWLRTAGTASTAKCIQTNGTEANVLTEQEKGIVLGFCL